LNKSRRRILVWAGVIILIIVLIGFGLWFLISNIPSSQEQFPQNDLKSSLIILSPTDQSSYPADSSIPIRAASITDNPISTFELWVNGKLLVSQQPDGHEGKHFSHIFYWTPTTEDKARILVRSINNVGETTTSNPIRIQITDPAGFQLQPRDSQDGQNDQVVYPLGLDQTALPVIPELPLESPQVPSPGVPLNNDLSLWLGQRFSSNSSAPLAPHLVYSLEQCSINLVITDQADNELGFFIYRSVEGSPTFERIAELEIVEKGTTFSYIDPDPASETIYYTSAFNGAGESPSPPVMVTLTDPSCPGAKNYTALEDLGQEELNLLDLAYFYYSFNGSGYVRYPQDPDSFLTPSEYPTSLRLMLEGLTSASPSPVSYADVVVWGWNGGTLVNLGAYHLKLDDSRLAVCNLGTGCIGDVASGFRSTYGELANDGEDQIREFFWSTTAPGTTSVLWQISSSPFSRDFSPHPYGLIGAGCTDGKLQGSFLIDFNSPDEYLPAPSSCGGYSQPWIEFSKFSWSAALKPETEVRYYIRFTPMAGNQPSGKPSNMVEILAKPGETLLEPVIVDHLPDIYDVEIIDFVPIKNMIPQYWGCVSIKGLDYGTIWNYYRSVFPNNISDGYIDQITSSIYDSLDYAVQNNLIVCPAPYSGSSSSGSVLSDWGSMFIEGISEIWDSVVSAFNALKDDVVNLAANLINDLGIPCDSDCKAGLKIGLEIGIAYFTGIPPNLPTFEQLADQGIEYAIQMAAAEAGIPCPEDCQQILREGIEGFVKTVAESNSQPGCVDESWAKLLGKHSLCLPPGVDTEAVPEGVAEPARAYIQITRKGQFSPGQYKYNDQPAYVVNVHFTGENTLLSGTTIPYTYYYRDWNTGTQHAFTAYAPITTLQNNVFDSQSFPIPPLEPGDSVIIPLSLTKHRYYIPEHVHSFNIELNKLDLEEGAVGGIDGARGSVFDWLCLHNGSKIKIEAEVACLSMPVGLIGSTSPDENSQLVPCGDTAQPYIYQENSDACYP